MQHMGALADLCHQGVRYAQTAFPILLLGETGVGKEVLARYLHSQSPRRNELFFPVNCGAIPPSLFESELFGYERGAFSGAQQSKRGILRATSGGTLFLDEIGELDPPLQVKLLRLLERHEVRPVGATHVETVDVRIMAATNVDLYGAVARKEFRLDLLERLSVLTLHVPPLRERPADIERIATEILGGLGVEYEPQDLHVLCNYYWPGNARQLKNLLTRASVLRKGPVDRQLLETLLSEEKTITAPLVSPIKGLAGSLEEIEKRAIMDRLEACHGNRKRTAEELGIAKSTLQDKLRKWRQDESLDTCNGDPDSGISV